jgi:SAM-dependent methyltransferase
MKKFQPYIDFYHQHSISPVHQDLRGGNFIKHFQCRRALYLHLGVVPSMIKGKSVLEFGPGSGHNALFTNAQQPERYVLVDGNQTGLKETKENIEKYSSVKNVEFIYSLIENYSSSTPFDIVLCEALIAFQVDPMEFVKIPAQFVAPGGVFIITCTDSVAVLSDWLRRLYGAILVREVTDLEERLALLRAPFETHLSTLAGMSRPIDDWLLDNVIQCLSPNIGRGRFSIGEAISVLDADFDVYQSSPNFMTDWRWYKNIYGEELKYNQRFCDGYLNNLHSMLDYRCDYAPRNAEDNRELLALCDQAFDLIHQMLRTNTVSEQSYLQTLKLTLDDISDNVDSFSRDAALAIRDFSQFLDNCDSPESYEFNEFIPFWGRGTQYLSLVKR